MDILTIGIIAAIAYFALQDGSESESGFREQPAGYNPDVKILADPLDSKIFQDRVEIGLLFTVKNTTGDKFKNNRLAGSLFLGNQKIGDFRNAKNFTLSKGETYTLRDTVSLNLAFKDAISDPLFWANVTAAGDFESKDKDKIRFDNLIDPGVNITSALNQGMVDLSPVNQLVKKQLGLP